jgi:radical SAM enzyme (TIGR01210 family)
VSTTYPARHADRDRFVLEHRGARPAHDPWGHQGVLVEDERARSGDIVRTATVFLTGRECPWRCVMCDLWRFTLETDTPPGAIPHQIGLAIDELRASEEPLPTHIKLYNAGSFFDPRAVPPADYDAIATHLGQFDHVIVESHPSLVGSRVDDFLASLETHSGPQGVPTLEVAMGLETTHPSALDRLHKRMTVADFARAADALRDRDVSLRAFLLVFPPFVPAPERYPWVGRSVDAAFACGASAVSLIPLRLGNGALEALGPEYAAARPGLDDVERVFVETLDRARGRVFVDLWDLERIASCRQCFDGRRQRLARMNLEQRVLPPVACASCGGCA